MNTRRHMVHFIANCTDCPLETGDFLEGPDEARSHAAKNKHRVTAESGFAIEYNGKVEKGTNA
jgi:hypothetical protein